MSLYKAELHVHLEGTIAPDLARILAQRNQVAMPENLVAPDGVSYLSDDFLHFLKVYDDIAALIKKPQDYYDVTFDYLRKNALKNTLYVEMMYSPDHAEQSSGIPSKEHLAAIQQAIDDAEAQYGIVGRIIITAVRHFGEEAAIRVAENGVRDRLPCVTGFGLGGDEANFPPHLFKRSYEIAHDGGLGCTVHAGEFSPAESIVDAINTLPISRIGHGVRSATSPDTRAIIKDRGISLELCPTSNVFLGLFSNLEHHPLPRFYKEGIRISINSDDPPFFKTDLNNEYRICRDVFKLSDAEINSITRMAIEDAFVDNETKTKLLAKLNGLRQGEHERPTV